MEEKEIEAFISASENVDSILLLSNLVENAIENESIEKSTDFYLLFRVFKNLSQQTANSLQEINF